MPPSGGVFVRKTEVLRIKVTPGTLSDFERTFGDLRIDFEIPDRDSFESAMLAFIHSNLAHFKQFLRSHRNANALATRDLSG